MKKRILAGLISGCVALSGCASMLERDYYSVTPHSSTTTDIGTSSVLRVENYQELLNSLIFFLSSATETGIIRLYMDSAAAEEMLANARLELLEEYPPAVYAVEDIQFESDPLVTYTESRVTFSYRRTQQQAASIISVNGISAVRGALASAMKEFSTECVLNINYFDQDEDFIRSLIRQAYYSAPATALEYPELEIFFYPDSGRQRIVEVLFHYQTDLAQLSHQAVQLEQACEHIVQSLPHPPGTGSDPMYAAQAILDEGGYLPEGGSTAYHALLSGGANDEGLALAMSAVCAELSIPCKIAEGFLDDAPHFWNVVHTDSGWRHLDLSQFALLSDFHTDDQWQANGYRWEKTSLPACG